MTSVAELKWAKRWMRRARGGPSEGWISKTAPDEPSYEISSPESVPHAHSLALGRQAAGEEQSMAALRELFSDGISSDV